MKKAFLLLSLFLMGYSYSQDAEFYDLSKVKNSTLKFNSGSILKIVIFPELIRDGDFVIKDAKGKMIMGDTYTDVDFIEINLNELTKGKYILQFTSSDEEREIVNLVIK